MYGAVVTTHPRITGSIVDRAIVGRGFGKLAFVASHGVGEWEEWLKVAVKLKAEGVLGGEPECDDGVDDCGNG